MKDYQKKTVSFLLFVALLIAISSSAFADSSVKNKIKSGNASSAQSSSAQTLLNTASNAWKIERPGTNDYTSPYTRYINAPMGHSVYVYDYWSSTDEHQIGTAFHGSKVTVLAKHGDFSCILYHEQDYQRKAAWVRSANLSASYPGNEIKVGYVLDPNPVSVGDPEMSWSWESFVGTGRKYSLLQEPIVNCVYFTLDYQVTSRNGAATSEVVGPRDVYVNDGSGWTWVCRFEYPTTGACHVKISLHDLTTIAAVAVIADCAKPDTYVCRQSLLDVLSYGGSAPAQTTSTPRKTWSQWSSWSTTPSYASSTREVETRQSRAVVGYNMVHYGTQQAFEPYYRMFRNYSIAGNFDSYGARYSYGEKHLTKYVTASQMNSAKSYPANGDFIVLYYNGEDYEGFQMGTTTAYNFGDDNKIWFIESEKYSTVTEYRYRDLK